MGTGFQRKRARLCLQFVTGEGACCSLDQVRILAVHHADQIRQLGRTVRVTTLTKGRRFALDLDRQVRQAGRYVLIQESRFDPAGCLKHFLPIILLGVQSRHLVDRI